jgi:type IV secretory pathway protease TraF
VVLAPPSRMESRGLARGALRPGVKAQVEGYAARDDPVEMRAERITIDGKTTELR